MACDYYNFVAEIEPYFVPENNETILDSLFRCYEKVIFKSIITTFGLDVFIKDQNGGDVDTIHNVRQGDSDYKNNENQIAYEQRGEYSHKQVEGPNTNFQKEKHKKRSDYGENPQKNTVQDAYEDQPLGFLGKSKGHPTNKSAELDHVISAKVIHDDPGRVLAGVSTVELADKEDNLRWTNEHLNKSMQEDEIPDYIEKHPELSEDTKQRMMDAYNQSKATYEKKLAEAYYFNFNNPNCRQFYRETANAAIRRGVEMGFRQALGFMITELWFDIKHEIHNSNGETLEVLKAIHEGIQAWKEDAKNNYMIFFEQLSEGVLNGIIASLTTTFLNTFVTTSKNIERIIRQSWSSIVEATGILLFDTKEKYYCDRMESAAKVLASGASMIIGTTIQQKVETNLAAIAIPEDLKKDISIFAGSLSTGLISVTLLIYIDNNPFKNFLNKFYGPSAANLRRQGTAFKEYCAELKQIDLQKLNHDTECVYELSQKLCCASDGNEINLLLKDTLYKLGISSSWEESTLDQKMKDPKWILII